MKDLKFADVFMKNFLSYWDKVTGVSKPTIAAVNGYAVPCSNDTFTCTPIYVPHFLIS